MRLLNDEDILKNRVDTISQYKILQYLKNNMNITEFDVYLLDRDIIKVTDINNDVLYFMYDSELKEITYNEYFIKNNNDLCL